jgi:Domain of unknown function (DUF5666)
LEEDMTVRKLGLFIAVLLVLGAVASAHGGKKHVIGTVEKVGPDSVTVKTEQGSVVVKLAAGTVYLSVGADKVAKPAKLSDLQVGERVVIHASTKPDESLEAEEVRFSTVTGAAAPAAKPS